VQSRVSLITFIDTRLPGAGHTPPKEPQNELSREEKVEEVDLSRDETEPTGLDSREYSSTVRSIWDCRYRPFPFGALFNLFSCFRVTISSAVAQTPSLCNSCTISDSPVCPAEVLQADYLIYTVLPSPACVHPQLPSCVCCADPLKTCMETRERYLFFSTSGRYRLRLGLKIPPYLRV
jgi:hypothetical protein